MNDIRPESGQIRPRRVLRPVATTGIAEKHLFYRGSWNPARIRPNPAKESFAVRIMSITITNFIISGSASKNQHKHRQ